MKLFTSALLLLLMTAVTTWATTISGPTAVYTNQTYTYTWNGSTVYTDGLWIVSNGTDLNEQISGTLYTLTASFSTAGTATIKFNNGGTTLGTLTVTVTYAPPVPNATTSTTYGCAVTSVTRSTTPPSGTDWYWQTSATGTSTTLGNSATMNVSTTGTTVYLRARQQASPNTWSASSQSIGTITVYSTTPGSPTTTTAVSRCGPGTVSLSATVGTNGDQVRWYSQATGGTLLATGTSYAPTVSVNTPYYVCSAISTSGCESSRTTVNVTVNTVPSAPTASGNSRFGSGSLTLTASGAPGGGSYQWYNSSSTLQSSSSTWTTPTVSTTTSNYGYATITSSAGCVSTSTWTNANIYSIPTITAPLNYVVMGSSVTLDAGAGYDSYSWKSVKNGSTVLGTAETLVASTADTYSVTVSKGGAFYTPTFLLGSELSVVNMNWIEVNTVLADSITNTAAVDNLPVRKVSQAVQYFDGLGRLIQTVHTQASPAGYDIVQPTVYDKVGREFRKYLPVTGGTNGQYKVGLLDSHSHYAGSFSSNGYNNGTSDKIADDTVYYSHTVFEASPLNRPLQDFGTGADWSVNNKSVVHQYLVNNSTSEQIIAWQVSTTTGLPVRSTLSNSSVSGGYYLGGQLSIKSTKDEQGNEVREYTSKEGHVVLKKVQLATGSPSLSDVTAWTQTYYIYDDLGLLRYVLQPELSKYVVQQGSSYNPIKSDLNQFAFQYQYDSYHRMIQKRVPGAGWTYMVYDDMDRLVMTQDSVQRTNNQWLVTKYDTLNRPVMTAIYSPGSAISQSSMTGQVSLTKFCEYYGASFTSNHGYSNRVFPTTNLTVLTVSYYDNYNFVSDQTWGSTYSFLSTDLSGQQTANNAMLLGHPTGGKVNVLGTSTFLKSVTYYDFKYRAIQTISDNNKGGWDRATNVLDFTGRVLNTKTTHHTSTHSDQTIARRIIYDPSSRVRQVFHTVNTNTEVLLLQNSYNEIGQLVDKALYSTNGGSSFKQSVDYRYNIRGWMLSMNNSQLANNGTNNDDSNDLFGFELGYNASIGTGNSSLYNGNISAMKWSSNLALGAAKDVGYNYSYDPLNRILSASYVSDNAGTWANATNAFSESGYTYDMNGNIKTLTRNGSTGSAMDNMTYTYSGNQLLTVTDAGDATKGFTDGNTSGNDYAYDGNGNMQTDKNKSLTASNAIQYNFLNLPTQVTKSTNEKIVYAYDASGRKLTQQVYNSSNVLTKTTEYDGEFIYQGDTLQFINHEEGRIVMKGATAPEYQYHLKDHLGNVRLTFTTKTLSITTYTAHFENPTAETSSFNNYQTTSAFISNTNSTSPTNSYHLNGGYGQIVGLTKSFSVMPGDQVSISANAKYSTPTGTSSNMTGSIISALLAGFNATAGTDAANGLTAYGNWDNGTTTITALGLGDEQRSDAIKAFVTIILFDRSYNLIDVTYQAVQSNGSMTASYTVKQPGYAYLYISNEHPYLTDVYFDDVVMSFTPSAVVQQEDFYPFGVTFNSYSRESSVPQNYLYNGKEQINDLNLDWADYGARMYMPEIGRWGVVDPLSEKNRRWSPYNYAMGNPIRFIDPDGMEVKAIEGGFSIDGADLQKHLGELQAIIDNAAKNSKKPEDEPDQDKEAKDKAIDPEEKEKQRQKYIDRYETIKAHANATMILGYVLLENGIGGDVLALAREMAFQILDPKDKSNRINDVLSYIKSEFTALKKAIPPPGRRITELYVSAAGAALVAQSTVLSEYNDFMVAPRVRQFAPDYYEEHIEKDHDYTNGGGGTHASWGPPDW